MAQMAPVCSKDSLAGLNTARTPALCSPLPPGDAPPTSVPHSSMATVKSARSVNAITGARETKLTGRWMPVSTKARAGYDKNHLLTRLGFRAGGDTKSP